MKVAMNLVSTCFRVQCDHCKTCARAQNACYTLIDKSLMKQLWIQLKLLNVPGKLNQILISLKYVTESDDLTKHLLSIIDL